jgi:hypothetical protein
VIKVYEGLIRPQARAQFVSRDQLTRALEQHLQNNEWLSNEFDPGAIPPEFMRSQIRFEGTK